MKNFYALLLLTILQQPLYAINIKLLKDTHTILADTNYAPFRGLIFLEEDIAKQWYQLSPSYQTETITKTAADMRKLPDFAEDIEKISSLEAAIVNILKKTKNSATDDLVMQMFHIAGEAFNITAAKNNPVRQLTPKYIGSICRILSDSTSQPHLEQDETYRQALLSHIKTRKKITPKDQELTAAQLLETYKKLVTDKSGALLPAILQNYLKTKIVDYLFSLNLIKSSRSIFQKKDFNPFVDALVNALQECNPTNPDCSYANNTAQGLLIGYMLAKVNDHNDLQDYFRGFNNDDSFTLSQKEYTNDELKQLSEQKPNIDNIASFADYLCAVIFTNKYMSALPKIVGNIEVEYQANSFPDCVETMMRNLVNIITYDAKNQIFGRIPAGLTINRQLKTFYANKYNANPAMVGNKNVHRAWLKLVENHEGCSYNRLVIRGTQDHKEVRGECDGVIPMNNINTKLPKKEIIIAGKTFTLFEQKVKDKTYWLTPTTGDLDCFELMPTLTNIIVLLNKLFNLNLTSFTQGVSNKFHSQDFAHEALQSNFIALYFEKMCKKFNWTIEKEIHDQVKLLQHLPDQSIQIPIELPTEEIFSIDITDKTHGGISIDNETEFKDLITIDEFFAADTSLQATILASKMISWHEIALHESSKPWSKIFNHTEKPFEKIDKFIPAINKDNKFFLMIYLTSYQHDDAYIALLLISFSIEFDIHYQNQVCTTFISEADYITPKNLQILNILAEAFYGISDLVVGKIVCAILEKNYDQMWHWTELGMQNPENYMRKLIIDVLQSLCSYESLRTDVLATHLDKIDLILSWINKDLQDSDAGTSCASLLLMLITYNLINNSQAPKALAMLDEIKETSFDDALQVSTETINEAKEKLTSQETLSDSSQDSDGPTESGRNSNNETPIRATYDIA